MSLHHPIAVRPLDDFRLWVEFPDGVSGATDLADVAGKGVFAAWKGHHSFQQVSIAETGELVWSDGFDVCADASYRQLTAPKVP